MFKEFLLSCWQLLNFTSFWLVASFLLSSLVQAVLPQEYLQQSLGNTKWSSLVKSTIAGMLLPICNCGVVPLTLSLYHSGAYLGPTLAFLVAVPIISPAAVLLALALFGPQVTIIYGITGLILPILIGAIANRWGGEELVSPTAKAMGDARAKASTGDGRDIMVGANPSSFHNIRRGLDWGIRRIGLQVSRYVLVGIAFAGLLSAVIPDSLIQSYLRRPEMISLTGAATVGVLMYVCMVGHIPFVAALIAAGAAPGVAFTFLLTGMASNLPELISIGKLIGKRTILIYLLTVISASFLVGYATNLLLPNFIPVFDLTKAQTTIEIANKLNVAAPPWVKSSSAIFVLVMGVSAWWPAVAGWVKNFAGKVINAQ